MYKRIINIVLSVIVIFVELLPNGVVLIFATSPTERVREVYSYFSLIPFGYGNIFPIITAILSIIILIISIIYFIYENNYIIKIIFFTLIVSFIISILTIVQGINYLTFNGIVILILLFIQIMCNWKIDKGFTKL